MRSFHFSGIQQRSSHDHFELIRSTLTASTWFFTKVVGDKFQQLTSGVVDNPNNHVSFNTCHIYTVFAWDYSFYKKVPCWKQNTNHTLHLNSMSSSLNFEKGDRKKEKQRGPSSLSVFKWYLDVYLIKFCVCLRVFFLCSMVLTLSFLWYTIWNKSVCFHSQLRNLLKAVTWNTSQCNWIFAVFGVLIPQGLYHWTLSWMEDAKNPS